MTDEDQQTRVRTLPCWQQPVDIAPLSRDCGAADFRVIDRQGVYVAKVGQNHRVHGRSRRREAAAHRAAHGAGLAPRVVYAGDDALVREYIEGRLLTASDLQGRIDALAMILRRCHVHTAPRLHGEAAAFWVFHVLRDYARQLEAAGHPLIEKQPRLLAIAEKLEEAQAPMRMVFGHHDLSPDNFLDDGERLWLIDWEWAGFGTAAFDLANLSANADFSDADDKRLLDAYFGSSPSADVLRSFAAMKVASSLRDAMGAMICGLSAERQDAAAAARPARKMKRFETLYTSFRDRF
jgi:thiamine kinase-like enzyme